MANSSDKLVEIQRSDWPKLLDLYVYKKVEFFGYNLLKTQINCTQQNPELNVRIYSLNGDWDQDGIFILNDHNSVIVQALSVNNDKILRALNCLNRKQTFLFYALTDRLVPAFKDYYINLGRSYDAFQLNATYVYHISKEKVKEFKIELPTGITLARLKTEYAEFINNLWPHKREGSVHVVERFIRYNINIGAFNEDGQLIAWALQLPIGSIGLLQVLAEHRRRGLGSLIVRAQSKQLAAKGFEVVAPVIFENVASCTLFESLGFRVIDKTYWAMRPGEINKM